MKTLHLASALLAGVVLTLSGCGGGGGNTVEGTVKGPGGPLPAEAAIYLQNKTNSYAGSIEEGGKFKIAEGVPDGEYTVYFSGPVFDTKAVGGDGSDAAVPGDTGDPEGDDDNGGGDYMAVSSGNGVTLDPKYNSGDTSDLKITVPSDSYDITVK